MAVSAYNRHVANFARTHPGLKGKRMIEAAAAAWRGHKGGRLSDKFPRMVINDSPTPTRLYTGDQYAKWKSSQTGSGMSVRTMIGKLRPF